MARYKIGITERGDAGKDLSWVQKLNQVDGAIAITKCISPDFHDAVLENRDKLIVHATCTGYGHTVLEPNVPSLYMEFNAVMALVKAGFPMERVVIRVDPIIPTKKGLEKAAWVIRSFMEMGFTRYRVSVIDMYAHVRDRFRRAGLPCPYGDTKMNPSVEQLAAVDEMLLSVQKKWTDELGRDLNTLRIESCAEPGLKVPITCGCISDYDLQLLGLETEDVDHAGYQRKGCMCYSGKTELLMRKEQCEHRCLYCYWTENRK